MEANRIIQGDCLEELKKLPDECVHCAITSPPYFGLRDYGMTGQIGLEDTPDAFVARLVEVFREVKRVLRDDGTLWLNLGDSYAGSWGNYGGKNRGAGTQRIIRNGSMVDNPAYKDSHHWRPPTSGKLGNGIKNKDLIGIPWMVAFALRADGWYLRQDIIWHKPNPMPESVTDRCTKAHEYVFLLSKSERYYFNHEAVKEPSVEPHRAGKTDRVDYRPNGTIPGQTTGADKLMVRSLTRNRRSVWTVSTKPFKGAHFATFPPDLIEPMVLAGCPENGLVLDPFMGSGTTALVAKRLGRNYLGIELNPEYMAMAEARLNAIPSTLFSLTPNPSTA